MKNVFHLRVSFQATANNDIGMAKGQETQDLMKPSEMDIKKIKRGKNKFNPLLLIKFAIMNNYFNLPTNARDEMVKEIKFLYT